MENDVSNITVEGTVPYFSHETEKYIKASSSPICVDWKVHESRNTTGKPVSSGRAYTTSDIDYTIKVNPVAIFDRLQLTSARLKLMACSRSQATTINFRCAEPTRLVQLAGPKPHLPKKTTCQQSAWGFFHARTFLLATSMHTGTLRGKTV